MAQILVLLHLALFFLSYFPAHVGSQTSFPSQIAPLAIRSPYFNCWNNVAPGKAHNWPGFWNQQGLGWVGHIRVDGQVYEWLGGGDPTFNFTTQLDLQVTPTRTIYSLQAGPHMGLNITFLTPIESDPVKQSLPFIYVYLDAHSLDGLPHDVQVYVDITAEWSSGNRSANVTWKSTKTDTSTYHQVKLQSPTPLTELADQAEDTTTYIAMRSGPSMSFTVAPEESSRSGFAAGALPNPVLETSGAINNPVWAFAIAVDLGNITQTAQSVVWSLGIVRNPTVAYRTSTGSVVDRAPYFVVQYSDVESAIDAFLLDSDDARQRAVALDTQILGDSSNTSVTCSSLVSIAARQTLGATELTVANGTDGKWNTSDVMMFMKDVGNSGYVRDIQIIAQVLTVSIEVGSTQWKRSMRLFRFSST
ncbi:hypothetical protein EUX98_g9520 [Antrodiella citrinella]|uniref:Glutaminase A N-terminal domain-containing protein n=1 Tax=Antrodiella citrinella TaxID=2447956 RepID=A0A4V3XEV3_9APHY|nr:hypothetical protein EUX98_g9520 [Antrodiella citrinella]